jgi:hypothetical protein
LRRLVWVVVSARVRVRVSVSVRVRVRVPPYPKGYVWVTLIERVRDPHTVRAKG